MVMAAVAMMGLAGCDHYNCSTAPVLGGGCTASTQGLGTSGTGGSATAAFAFAVDEAGTIDGYTLDTTDGTFQSTTSYTAPIIPTNEQGYGMVVAQKQYLYAAFLGTGQIFGWTIGSGGGLTSIAGSPFSAPYLIGIGSNQGPHDMIVNPAGTLLFVDDVSVQGVYVYSIGSGGTLTAVNGSPFAVPFFPGNMTTDGLGNFLYVATDTNPSEIAAYSIGSTGTLTPVAGSPFAYPVLQVQGDPTGKYLIGVKGGAFGDTHLYLFSIAQSGAITQLQAVTTVYSPFSLAVQPNTGGNLVYTFSENATQTGYNPIEGYQLSNGTLSAVKGSPFSNVSDGFWAQFDQSGTFLFPYSTVINASTGIVTTQLGVLDVASSGALTQPISPATLATSGFWAVTDPQ
jgi:6-phosphogluconolactonase (cycloisomerase 2 family)